MANATAVMEPISKSDRNELRRIVKARFVILTEQLAVRADELHGIVKKTIEDETKDSIKTAKKRAAKLEAKAKALGLEIRAFEQEIKAEGVTNGRSSWNGPIKTMEGLIENCLTDFEPDNLTQRVGQTVGRIKKEHNIHGLDLKQQELALLEDLSVDALEGSKAKEFLGAIPQIDKLLPIPEEEARKALVASS
jgi:hypothetical protein